MKFYYENVKSSSLFNFVSIVVQFLWCKTNIFPTRIPSRECEIHPRDVWKVSLTDRHCKSLCWLWKKSKKRKHDNWTTTFQHVFMTEVRGPILYFLRHSSFLLFFLLLGIYYSCFMEHFRSSQKKKKYFQLDPRATGFSLMFLCDMQRQAEPCCPAVLSRELTKGSARPNLLVIK